jgi:hypothetical protein
MADKLEGDSHGLYEFRLCFDGRDPRQLRRAALAHAVDVWSQVELVDVSAARGGPPVGPAGASEAIQSGLPVKPSLPEMGPLRLVTPAGEILTGYELFVRLVRSLRLLWPLAVLTWIPGVASLGQKFYPSDASPWTELLPEAPKPPVQKVGTTSASEAIQPKNGLRS